MSTDPGSRRMTMCSSRTTSTDCSPAPPEAGPAARWRGWPPVSAPRSGVRTRFRSRSAFWSRGMSPGVICGRSERGSRVRNHNQHRAPLAGNRIRQAAAHDRVLSPESKPRDRCSSLRGGTEAAPYPSTPKANGKRPLADDRRLTADGCRLPADSCLDIFHAPAATCSLPPASS